MVTFSGNLLYFLRFMTMYFADIGVWPFMMGQKKKRPNGFLHILGCENQAWIIG